MAIAPPSPPPELLTSALGNEVEAAAPYQIFDRFASIAGTVVALTCEAPEQITDDTPRILLLPGLPVIFATLYNVFLH